MQDQRKGIVYNFEQAMDIRVHTGGIDLGYLEGKLKTYYLTRYYTFNIGYIKHPKEFRQNFGTIGFYSTTSKPFVYGKQNSLLVVRAGVGQKKYLSEKAKRRGIAVGINYEIGPTLGLLKPYFLDLNYQEGNGSFSTTRSEKYSEENAETFLDLYSIEGSSGFTRGFSETKLMPGVHGKFAIHFSWGAFEEKVRAIEGGIMFDLFTRQVPLMIIEQNRPYFINLYISLHLGKRK